MLRWRRGRDAIEDGETSSATIEDEDITRGQLVHVWAHFFEALFIDNPGGQWDVVHCDVMELPWMMLIYPFRAQDMTKDLGKLMRVRFPGQDAVMAAASRALRDATADAEAAAELEGDLNGIVGDRILQLAAIAAEDYARSSGLFSKRGMDNLRIELWSHGETCRVTITSAGTVYAL